MQHYILKLYRRRRAGETRGFLDGKIEFDAPDLETARQEGYIKLADLSWETHFAALEDEDGQSVIFWTSAP